MIKAWPLLVVSALAFSAGCGSSGDSKSTAVVANPDAPTVSTTGGPSKTEPSAIPSNLSPQELAAQADVPVYPGASFPDKQTKAPNKDESGKLHTYLVMSTSDKPNKVVEFYVKGGKYSEMKTKEGSEVQGLSPKGNLVLIDITEHAGQTIISVKSVQG